MLPALPDGHALCKLCCKGWPTDVDFWAEHIDTLRGWSTLSTRRIDAEDYNEDYISMFCEGTCVLRYSFKYQTEGEAFRLVNEKMGLYTKGNGTSCGHLCPAYSLQITWEGTLLNTLLTEAGYQPTVIERHEAATSGHW